jgi:hypothetical protein
MHIKKGEETKKKIRNWELCPPPLPPPLTPMKLLSSNECVRRLTVPPAFPHYYVIGLGVLGPLPSPRHPKTFLQIFHMIRPIGQNIYQKISQNRKAFDFRSRATHKLIISSRYPPYAHNISISIN